MNLINVKKHSSKGARGGVGYTSKLDDPNWFMNESSRKAINDSQKENPSITDLINEVENDGVSQESTFLSSFHIKDEIGR